MESFFVTPSSPTLLDTVGREDNYMIQRYERRGLRVSFVKIIPQMKMLTIWKDYLKCILSIGMAILSQFRNLIVPVLPYVALLGAFGAFVVWNGGVVLGTSHSHQANQ